MPQGFDRHEFARRLAVIRRYRGFSQERLAKAAGVSPSTIALYELARSNPNASTLTTLCDTLGCSLDVILGRVPLTIGEDDAEGEG